MLGAAQIGLMCAYSDCAPNFSSAFNSIGNTIGAIAGIVGPLIVAELTSDFPNPWGWRLTFFVTGFLALISLIPWTLYMKFEPIPELNNPRPKVT